MSDTLTNITIEKSKAQEILAPFISKQLQPNDPEILTEIAKLDRRWKRRRWKRQLLGWLPTGMQIPRLLRGARNQQYVLESYNANWERVDWPSPSTPPRPRELVYAQWENGYLFIRSGALSRIHLALMADVIEELKPRTILEVGSGNGLNLFTLASRFPEIEFTGVELTDNGVAQAQAAQQSRPLPHTLVEFFPWPMKDEQALRQLTFRQGDACALPFEDSSFDLVFTRLALEQMETIRDKALREISRVARHHTMMVEPFAEFNQDSTRFNYVKSKDYFSLPYAQLEQFGIEPIYTFSNFPQKLTLGAGLVVGKVGTHSTT
ncbi:MAG: hypothetical protein NPIRA01_36530 [Nitrospirales bacterium]|nr:MAG: hypothetical protein NPIRA01_36530 [Nitrospirales bacterium]